MRDPIIRIETKSRKILYHATLYDLAIRLLGPLQMVCYLDGERVSPSAHLTPLLHSGKGRHAAEATPLPAIELLYDLPPAGSEDGGGPMDTRKEGIETRP